MKHIQTFTHGLDVPVSLHQRVNGEFAVMYGMHTWSGLDYAAACKELGSCIMHSLACKGVIGEAV